MRTITSFWLLIKRHYQFRQTRKAYEIIRRRPRSIGTHFIGHYFTFRPHRKTSTVSRTRLDGDGFEWKTSVQTKFIILIVIIILHDSLRNRITRITIWKSWLGRCGDGDPARVSPFSWWALYRPSRPGGCRAHSSQRRTKGPRKTNNNNICIIIIYYLRRTWWSGGICIGARYIRVGTYYNMYYHIIQRKPIHRPAQKNVIAFPCRRAMSQRFYFFSPVFPSRLPSRHRHRGGRDYTAWLMTNNWDGYVYIMYILCIYAISSRRVVCQATEYATVSVSDCERNIIFILYDNVLLKPVNVIYKNVCIIYYIYYIL